MKIDFYILDTTSNLQGNLFACKLLEKLYMENQTGIYIHTNSKEEAERLDNLLWTYRDDSFIPHQIYTAENTAPIQIGFDASPVLSQNILFNFANDIPSFYQQYQQIIEIVYAEAHIQSMARKRYKQYRDAGYEINTIK